MNLRTFRKYLKRDNERCLHCGMTGDTLIPQHRANRGMGGSKNLDKPSNVIVLCSAFNGRIEADSDAAELARFYGWKLESWEIPEFVPVYDFVESKWYRLDNGFGREFLFEGRK